MACSMSSALGSHSRTTFRRFSTITPRRFSTAPHISITPSKRVCRHAKNNHSRTLRWSSLRAMRTCIQSNNIVVYPTKKDNWTLFSGRRKLLLHSQLLPFSRLDAFYSRFVSMEFWCEFIYEQGEWVVHTLAACPPTSTWIRRRTQPYSPRPSFASMSRSSLESGTSAPSSHRGWDCSWACGFKRYWLPPRCSRHRQATTMAVVVRPAPPWHENTSTVGSWETISEMLHKSPVSQNKPLTKQMIPMQSMG